MITKNMNRAFTILELLVVVAIVALLAGVIMTATNSSRNKGGDAGVKSNLHTLQNQAELFYGANANSYLPSGGSPFLLDDCPVSYDSLSPNMFKDKFIFDAIKEAKKRGGNVGGTSGAYCYNSATKWAVAVELKSSTTASPKSWCVDSGGIAREVAAFPNTAINSTTFICI